MHIGLKACMLYDREAEEGSSSSNWSYQGCTQAYAGVGTTLNYKVLSQTVAMMRICSGYDRFSR